MKNKSRKRKRNKKDKIIRKVSGKKYNYTLANAILGDDGLDIRDIGLLPHPGNWGEVVSSKTGIRYRVLIGDIKRVR